MDRRKQHLRASPEILPPDDFHGPSVVRLIREDELRGVLAAQPSQAAPSASGGIRPTRASSRRRCASTSGGNASRGCAPEVSIITRYPSATRRRASAGSSRWSIGSPPGQQHERGAQRRHLGLDLVQRHVGAAVKSEGAVAVGATQVAPRRADERAGESGVLRLTLDAAYRFPSLSRCSAAGSTTVFLWQRIVPSVYFLRSAVSHLVAYYGNEPENVACALFSARLALFARRTQRERARAWVRAGLRSGRRRPAAEAPARRDRRGRSLQSGEGHARRRAESAAIGLGHDGNTLADDADPFRFRSWLFGSIGEVNRGGVRGDPRAAAREHARVSPAQHPRPLAQRAPLPSVPRVPARRRDSRPPTPPPAAVQLRCRAASHSSIGYWPAMAARRCELALAATNGRCFVAASFGYPMRYLDVRGSPTARSARPRRAQRRPARSAASRHESLRAFVIEATRDGGARPGWRDVPDRSALIAGPDRAPQLASLCEADRTPRVMTAG